MKKKKPKVSPWPRKLARSVARANMEAQGVKRINRTHYDRKEEPNGSFFARNWKDYATMPTRRAGKRV